MRNVALKEAAAVVAKDNEIDEYGMTFKEIKILTALGQKPIAGNRIHSIVNVKKQEFDCMIAPSLLIDREGHGPLVAVTPKGFAITRMGVKELQRRNLTYRGDDVLAERLI